MSMEGGMMDSILDTIKEMLGYGTDPDPTFDRTIMVHINTAFSELSEVGVLSDASYRVTSRTNTWEDAFGGRKDVDLIQTYVFLSVKLIFDPPSSSFVLNALVHERDRIEWRISVKGDEGEV